MSDLQEHLRLQKQMAARQKHMEAQQKISELPKPNDFTDYPALIERIERLEKTIEILVQYLNLRKS